MTEEQEVFFKAAVFLILGYVSEDKDKWMSGIFYIIAIYYSVVYLFNFLL